MTTQPHLLRRLIAVVIALGLSFTAVPVSQAQQESTTIEMKDFGLGEITSFQGQSTEVPFIIPVPPGITPTRLTGTFQLPAEYAGGTIELYSGRRLRESISLEVKGFLADVEIPLDKVEIIDGQAVFSLRAVMDVKDEQWCVDEPELKFLDGAVEYSGEARHPEVLADFLPPILKVLSIYVPAEPSEHVQQATLELATSLASVYRATGVDVRVLPLEEGETQPSSVPEQRERQIVISGSGNPGMRLMNPGQDDLYLHITGEDTGIADQARLMTDSLLPLAADDQVETLGFGDIPDVSTEVATLRELGNYALESESLARTQVFITVERSQLRPFVESFDLRLTGSYTPLPDSQAGQISVRVGDDVVDFFTADDTGIIDRTFTIPSDLIGRYTDIVVEYRTTGDIGCGTTQPVGLQINGESMVFTVHTDVPMLSGFLVLPQAFQPAVDVTLAGDNVENLARAVRIMVGVQSLSSERIRPQVVSWDEAVDSPRSTLFVDPAGELSHEVPLYISEEGTKFTVVHAEDGGGVKGKDLLGSVEAEEEPEIISEELGYFYQLRTRDKLEAGALQAVWDEKGKRMILVASSNNHVDQLDGLLDWLEAEPSRWGGIQGDLLARVDGRTPVDLAVSHSPIQPQQRSGFWIALSLAGLVIAVAVVISRVVARRTRKKAQGSTQQPEGK